ncbi:MULTISPECIES: hypothetical protein [unclassified Bradyrhizobium]|uniref:hypothetical protein n=1 Tax=unclassified Bradyrhizobium TaxID=2631580 RepID=UPI001BA69E12|nr:MULTISPECIES: hypothetical protein [unclassified Bradyrhizobium]MBR1206634.1 hypothetical protein [Bradyrhizobium sp. AUGA SZCCT0124]MBR1315388.1 hypothetical protein [Bradyrhizobium sp. AUGA SZCCT0051]MBR1338550.1 hypothetical protein [Bradyrhizobium sp. AUGA SZCCT0105]MBR1356205.1 hypothetical protein [Bradyrhizobium sp. AUGA SZCCT0045]
MVIWDGISIGRIHRQQGMPRESAAVAWNVNFPVQPQQPWQRGHCVDVAECQRMVKLVWGAIRPTLTEEDIREGREWQERGKNRPWNRPKHWQD